MSRKAFLCVNICGVVGIGAASSALASCAMVSGLADKEVVDCPVDCSDAAMPPREEGPTTADASAMDAPVDAEPKCDPATDAACMVLPTGFTLVVRNGVLATSACPSGMTPSGVANGKPVPAADACTCDVCSVTPAPCSGRMGYAYGFGCGNTGSAAYFADAVAGNCYQDIDPNVDSAKRSSFTLPAATGGACSSTGTVHSDRVSFGESSAICDDASRCSGGFCDTRFDPGVEVCVAKSGDVACPPEFPSRHVVGTSGADLDCGACACTVNPGTCSGSVHLFTDQACTTGEVVVPANGTCSIVDTNGKNLSSYKLVATASTTCTATGKSAATNARMKNPRTLCCRQ